MYQASLSIRITGLYISLCALYANVYCVLLCMLLLTRIAHHSMALLGSLIFLAEIIIMKEEGASERARWAVCRVEYVSHEKYVIALVTLAIFEHTANR